jgi:hypothetical protein
VVFHDQKWTFYRSEEGECQDVTFQVWRWTSEDTFTLVTEFKKLFTEEMCYNGKTASYYICANNVHVLCCFQDTLRMFEFDFSEKENLMVPVQQGDILGW